MIYKQQYTMTNHGMENARQWGLDWKMYHIGGGRTGDEPKRLWDER